MPTQKPVTQYSISAVSRITGKSRSTIQRDLKAGKLSFVKGSNGAKLIDAAEVARAYPDACDFSREEGGDTADTTAAHAARERDELKERLELLNEERRREREQLQSQIEHLQQTLKLAQEGHNRATQLLEDQSGRGDKRGAIEAIEKRFAEQQSQLDERLTNLSRTAKQQAVDELRGMSWWSVLRKLTTS